MSGHKISQFSQIFSQFNNCRQLLYSGKLSIDSFPGHKWNFYYHLGQLVWATGGIHPGRRWRRNIAQHCPQININQLHLWTEDLSVDYWDYRLVENLYKQEKISKAQINFLVRNTIVELLFDLAQEINFNHLNCELHKGVMIKEPITSISVSMSLKQMQELWKNWSEAGLGNFSPNLAPVLRKPCELQKLVSPVAYQNFENLINGNYTLWDLAVKMKQDVLQISRSLLPFIHKGITELKVVSDIPLPVAKFDYAPIQLHNTPLIACVDDSHQVCKMLERIITSNGMRFIGIENPAEALPTLIEKTPDLIFLDLIMPLVNGYEICSQLRRTSILANTPIVILTGSDGLFDKVRSKVYGATEFITKPVEAEKVLTVVNKHLGNASPEANYCYDLALSY